MTGYVGFTFLLAVQIAGVYSLPTCKTGKTHDYAQYLNDGRICCNSCPAGQHMSKPCTADNPSTTECKTCENGTYTKIPNILGDCRLWRKPCNPTTQVIKLPGSNVNDRECDCKSGYFRSADDIHCHKWAECDVGKGVIVAGDAYNNVRCAECKEGTFSDKKDALQPCLNHTICEMKGLQTLAPGTTKSDAICSETTQITKIHTEGNTVERVSSAEKVNPADISDQEEPDQKGSSNQTSVAGIVVPCVIILIIIIVILYTVFSRPQRVHPYGDQGVRYAVRSEMCILPTNENDEVHRRHIHESNELVNKDTESNPADTTIHIDPCDENDESIPSDDMPAGADATDFPGKDNLVQQGSILIGIDGDSKAQGNVHGIIKTNNKKEPSLVFGINDTETAKSISSEHFLRKVLEVGTDDFNQCTKEPSKNINDVNERLSSVFGVSDTVAAKNITSGRFLRQVVEGKADGNRSADETKKCKENPAKSIDDLSDKPVFGVSDTDAATGITSERLLRKVLEEKTDNFDESRPAYKMYQCTEDPAKNIDDLYEKEARSPVEETPLLNTTTSEEPIWEVETTYTKDDNESTLSDRSDESNTACKKI
uniref:Uncharacterized protein LOC102802950 n=1 Tax=Saccoglossus kowalevskii TaxID=10224 RepID=A0ABM0LXV1_SACKO|nr:PREDICTED: uncharacterized protein LOC102802950 [Saccoglossus kowalevskii]